MTAATADRLRGATRWSLTARCVRMAFYAFQGVDPVEPDEETLRMFERGRMDERWYVERLRKKYGRRGLRTQKAVPWPNTGMPLGELHEDAFIVPLAQPVEVKSHLSGGATEHDIVQLAGAILYDQDAGDSGALVVIDRDLRERITVVTLDDDLRAEVEGRAEQLVDAVLADTPPPRICEKPSDGRSHMCPFVEHCFAGWEQPERPRVETAEVIVLARQLYEVGVIKRLLSGSKADEVAVDDVLAADEDGDRVDAALALLRQGRTVKGVEFLERQIKARLTGALGRAPEDFLHDPGEYEVGPLVLKRKQVERAGFTVEPTSYELLTVKRVSDAPLRSVDEYGDEAPW